MSNVVSGESIVERLSWRYAVKKFDPARKIGAKDWAALERAMVLSPSSFGLQPWKFVVVIDPGVRAKLRPASWDQSQITDASHLVVFARRTSMGRADVLRWIDRIAEVRGVLKDSLNGYRDMMLGSFENPAPGWDSGAWAAKQVYIALGFFLAAAAMMGIDACPMEGFEPGKYDEILGLAPTGYAATVVATAGYRAADDTFASLAKARFDDRDVIQRV